MSLRPPWLAQDPVHPYFTGGTKVVISDTLPLVPSDGENARRMVRHGFADVLEWLGESVGPRPGEETRAIQVNESDGLTLFVSRDLYAFIQQQAYGDSNAIGKIIDEAI